MVGVMGGEEGIDCFRVVVVGGKGVGKSALAVRFLTKRYIGEYEDSKGTEKDTVCIVTNEDTQSHAVLQADGHIWLASGC